MLKFPTIRHEFLGPGPRCDTCGLPKDHWRHVPDERCNEVPPPDVAYYRTPEDIEAAQTEEPIDARGFPWRGAPTPPEMEKRLAAGMDRALYGGAALGSIYALNGHVSPLMLTMALAYYSLVRPKDRFSPAEWTSMAGAEARIWLRDNGLIEGENDAPTPKLVAWLMEVLATPLPVQRWEVPRG